MRQPTAFLTLVLLLTSAGQAAPETTPAESANDAAPAARAEGETGASRPFEPAAVGLADLPQRPATPEAFDAAIAVVEQRLAELGADARADAGADPGERDPRIQPLQDLHLALQREAAAAERTTEVLAALGELQAQRTGLAEDGLVGEAPYPITLLDRLRRERALSEQAAEGAIRAMEAAQRRVATAEKELAAAERQRRQLRDEAAQAAATDEGGELARRLEAARLASLAAGHRLGAARNQLALAGHEKALAEARAALHTAKLARIEGEVTFPREVLDARVAELAEREAGLQGQIAALNGSADAAEGALFDARRRLQRQDQGREEALLEAQVAAREAELAAARRGAEYLRQAVEGVATTRTLWERRYALMQEGGAKADLAGWLSEGRELLREIAEHEDQIDAEIANLRSVRLALSRRLAETDLDPALRRALAARHSAIDTLQGRAEELLVVHERLRPLAERLVEELEQRVRARTLAQHLEEAQVRLTQWWDTELFAVRDQGIYVRDLTTGIGVFALVLVAVYTVRSLLRRTLLPRLTSDTGQPGRPGRAIALALIRNTSGLFVVVVAFYAAMAATGLAHGQLEAWLWSLLIVVFWLQIGIWATAGAVDVVQRQRSRRELRDPSAVSGYGLILFFVRVGIWAVVLVSVLAHFDYPVTGIIGALGVGGIAIAFAVQNILADVFNSMAIILDKPFRVGDFIITGDTLGVVEQIGVKTTHIRSLSGEQVILSNTDILNSRIRNYKRMRERRVVFRLGVIYQTPPEKLEGIPRIVETIVRGQPHARFDRAHFFEYGDFALTFEIVYYVLSADYNLYMDTQQAINLALYRRFQEEGIQFAYPTQELILRRAASSETPAGGEA